jgi:hypothetical protein
MKEPFHAHQSDYDPLVVKNELLLRPKALVTFFCSDATFYSGLSVSISRCTVSEDVFLIQRRWLDDTVAWLSYDCLGPAPQPDHYPKPILPLPIGIEPTFIVATKAQLRFIQTVLGIDINTAALVRNRVEVGAGKKEGTVADFRPARISVVEFIDQQQVAREVHRDVRLSTSLTMEQVRCMVLEWCLGQPVDRTSYCATRNWR